MKKRIGIPVIGSADWIGGVCYVENLAKAVRLLPEDEQPQLFLLFADKDLEALSLHAHFVHLFDEAIYQGTQVDVVAKLFGRKMPSYASKSELASLVDFVYPAPDPLLVGVPGAAWIPDFQHVHLPQFFSPREIEERDRSFAWKASHANAVVFSSEDATKDFRRLYPDSTAKVRTLRFHTLPEAAWLQGDCVATQHKYKLPDRFVLCSNQFWAHKNHARVFEAIGYLRLMGVQLSLVCTGSNKDYRHQGYFDKLMTMPEALGIADQVHVLGNIPRHDQIQLMRRALAVVQPSLFEGWSTVVEDARALGKTMLLSDIGVHIEQAPDHGHFFPRHDAMALAELMRSRLPALEPGPNRAEELRCAEASISRVAGFGRAFCRLADEA